jgi:quercetin dioxygenase-like cupin family protein
MLSYLKQGQETAMNQTEFETELGEQGYSEVIDRRMEANSLNPEHAHDFDARLLVLEGAMTIISEGQERMYRAGDTFSMPAGCRHAEQCGPEGVRYLAGRRYRQAVNRLSVPDSRSVPVHRTTLTRIQD